MSLLDPLFANEAVCSVLSDDSTLQAMLDFEAALVKAEAGVGIVPIDAVAPIISQCKAELFEFDEIAAKAKSSGNLAIPLVHALTAQVERGNAEASRWVHWGATSQDVIDTGMVLLSRKAMLVISRDLSRLISTLTKLVEQHRNTIIVSRTWLQQAIPTTLGLKFGGWLDALLRHQLRLDESRNRLMVLQFGGAAGTLASLGSKGLAVSEALAKELDLQLPAVPWHTHRDRFVDMAAALGILAGTLGKIARDISLGMQTEVAEISEPTGEGRGGSSTLPHKRNPIAASVALSAAQRIPGLVSTMLSAMVQEHERGLGNWHAEWETLPDIFRLASGSLLHVADAVEGLGIHAARMRANLEISNGLVFAEAVSMALAQKIGKSKAHHIVENASRQAVEQNKHLAEVLEKEKVVLDHLSVSDLRQLFLPENYLGMANAFTNRVLHEARKVDASS